MESKIKDNKKLTKYLLLAGVGVLVLVFIVRLLSLQGKDTLTEMPSIGKLPYSPKEEKTLTKTEQYSQAEQEDKQEETVNLPKIDLHTSDSTPKTASKIIVQQEPEKRNSIPTIQLRKKEQSRVGEQSFGGSTIRSGTGKKKLEYQSAYLLKDPSTSKEEETAVPAPKNPFGTIGSSTSSLPETNPDHSAISYTAEIYGDQKIENGGNVLIRNTETITYQEQVIPVNSILYGQARFSGNRVLVNITKAKTRNGEYVVHLLVQDNDRINGFYYKAPIDQTVDNAKEDVNVNLPGKIGALNQVAETAIREGKDLMRRSQTLNLAEGYKLYLIPNKL